MAETSTTEERITSIKMPAEWWGTLKQLANFREVQNDVKNKSLNSLMLEVMEAGMENARLELAERRKRRPR